MPKIYIGTVLGYKKLPSGKYLLFCETTRIECIEGVGCDCVVSSSPYDLFSEVKYSIIKSRKGYVNIAKSIA